MMTFDDQLLKLLKLLSTVTLTHYLRHILKFTVVVIAAIVSASVLYVIVSLFISPEYRVQTLRFFGFYDFARYIEPGIQKQNLSIEEQDLFSVLPDHSAISSWVESCIGVKPGDPAPFPVAYAFWTPSQRLTTAPRLELDDWPHDIHRLDGNEQALVQLSKNLTEQRVG